jgi:hypothetical protein
VTQLRLRFLPDLTSLPGTLLWLGCALYLLGIAWWWMLRLVFADAWWWLFLLNSAAVFLFVPLPVAVLVAALQRNVVLIAGALFAVAIFLSAWGGLLLPHSQPDATGPVVTVMTYNLLVSNRDTRGVVDAIREANADVVGFVELNQTMARAIQRELAEEYPYQVMNEEDSVSGAGVISRYPIERVDVSALDDPLWRGGPSFSWRCTRRRARTRSTSGSTRPDCCGTSPASRRCR